MARPYLEQYLSNLELELNGLKFRQAFENIKSSHSVLRKYPTVKDLKALAQVDNRNYADKDEVMAILLRDLKGSNAIYPLVNLMFWDSLYRLYWQRYSRVDDHEELFSRIQLDFYHTVRSHNLERLPRKIDVNIFLNTKKRVIAWEKENIRADEALTELYDLSMAGFSPADLEESLIHPEEMETYLLDMVYRKIITEVQYDLLLDTLVYKRMSPQEWALQRSIPHATARILKHRAEKAIRRFEKKKHSEKISIPR